MNMGQDPFDEFILHQMPDFVAVNYHRALQAKTPRERVERYLHLYTLGLRAPAIILVSQYLLHDRREVRDAYLNDLLWNEFPHLTLDVWQKILFAALRTYHDKRDLFFMPELYDFYWDADTIPHRRRPDIERPFSRLTQIGIELTDHEKEPRDENGWTALADEVEGLVQGVLHSLSFLSQYDLIRVVGQDAESYSYEVHRGLDVTYGSGSLEPSLSPQPTDNWFYLRSEQGQLLELHPLFVFWNVELPRLPSTVADLGLYDRLLEARLRYILIQEGGTAFDANRVQDFNSLLFDTIQRVKKFRQESEHLTWGQLLDICKDISRPRMASVSEKFRPKLYVQRDAARREFERFLASDRKCFVLIGRSGVGKSNFLLALQDEVTYTRDDVCVLLYDGAQLSVGATFESTVARDFDQRISIGGKRLIEVWREIDKCEGIAGRQVILCVDAVNESTQATDLLRQLNELVQQDHPWLKVVFSSRPETWQAIRKGVILADALYYRQQDDTFGVTLAPFSFSQRLDEFSRIELVEAYAKHREVFDLQTAYEDLSAEQKEVLREPLNLYFIARSNQHGAIPSTLRASTLIEQYVEALLESQRLELDDLRLLEKQLLPLMVRDGHYSNAITSDDLDAAGEGLFEAIYSPQLMSDGHARNESFMRLMDAEILVSQRSGWNPRTAFKYERFYEYFAGRRILEISTSQLDREEYFSSLAMLTSGDMRTPAKPYLWGAVRNAMVADAVAHGMEVLENLCRTDQQRVKELMVDALTSLGVDHLEQVKILMRKLLPPTKKRSSFGRIRQLVLLC